MDMCRSNARRRGCVIARCWRMLSSFVMQMFIISINQNVMRSLHRISIMRISTRKEEEFEFTNSYDISKYFPLIFRQWRRAYQWNPITQ